MTITVKLDMRGLEELIKTAPDQVDAAVRSTAFGVQAIAQTLSPYLTGANRSSIYTKTSKGISGSPGALGVILPDVGLCQAVSVLRWSIPPSWSTAPAGWQPGPT